MQSRGIALAYLSSFHDEGIALFLIYFPCCVQSCNHSE
jgi:hypothetical protein